MDKIKQIPIIKSVIKLYDRIYNRLLDYLYKVPRTAGICFAYYMIIAIVPMMSLAAFIANLANIDLTIVEEFLSKFLTKEYSVIITQGLLNAKMTFGTLVILVISIYVVSRGINQIYAISKNFFPPDHERNMIIEIAISILKTLLVMIIIISMVASVTVLPILQQFIDIQNETLYMFLVIFVLMTLLYYVIPDCHVNLFDVLTGSFTATALLVILIKILGIYFSAANYQNVYGPLASIVIILMSLTFAAEVIYIGMYVMFENHMKRLIKVMTKEIEPRPTAKERLINIINKRKRDIQGDLIDEPQDSFVIDEPFYENTNPNNKGNS